MATTYVSTGGGASGLANLRSDLQLKGYGTDTAEAQTSMLNSVYRKIIRMRRWWFLEVADDQSLTCVAGQQQYNLNSIADLLHVDRVRLQSGDDYLFPRYLPHKQFFEEAHEDPSQGAPIYWTWVNKTLYLHPLPDTNYAIELDYVKDPPDLSGDDDEPVLPAAYQDLLVWGAIREITFRERDTEGWSIANTEFVEGLREMTHQDGLVHRADSDEVEHTDDVASVNDGYTIGTYGWQISS